MKKSIALVAMCATALSPIILTAAYADVIPEPAPQYEGDTLPGMQAQCDAFAAAAKAASLGDPKDIWSAEVIPGSATKTAGPTEVTGTRVVDEDSITPIGDYIPSTTEIRFPKADAHGHYGPFRVGGSVNMFGDQWSTAGKFPDSTYNFDATFASTFSYAFKCEISQSVHVPAQTIHHRAVGEYVFNDDGKGSDEDAIRANCQQYTDNGQPWWGDPYRPNPDNPRCKFVGTAAYDEVIPESWEPPVVVDTKDGTSISKDQTDTLTALEDHGGPVIVTGERHIGQVVVCISPSTTTKKGVPGAWRPQNGYSGELCTTDWMANHAVWGSGTENSNGTFISVPDYQLYNL